MKETALGVSAWLLLRFFGHLDEKVQRIAHHFQHLGTQMPSGVTASDALKTITVGELVIWKEPWTASKTTHIEG